MYHRILYSSLFAIVALGLAVPSWGQSQSRPRFVTREVKVYLWKMEDEGPPDRFGLVPVARRVSRVTPARGALEALLIGPARDERDKGLESPHAEGLSIKSLIIENHIAMVSLVSDCPECARWGGTLAPPRFRKAVELTLKQFSTIKVVKICLDGYEDFEDLRKKKCP